MTSALAKLKKQLGVVIIWQRVKNNPKPGETREIQVRKADAATLMEFVWRLARVISTRVG